MPKGQKECKCGATMGPRTKVCPNCHAVLIADTKVIDDNGNVVDLKETRNVFSYPEGYTIPENILMIRVAFPSGECPIKLKPAEWETVPGIDTIAEWAIRVREKMIPQGKFLTNSALIYWGKQYADYKTVKEAISGIPDVTYKVIESAA